MSRRVVITGYDLMTALGTGREITRERLFAGETGISETVMSACGESVKGVAGSAGKVPEVPFLKEIGLEPDRCMEMALLMAESCMTEAGLTGQIE